MPGPAFAEGDAVSLHPVEDEDHEFLQRGRNHPAVRRSLGSTAVETSDDVADLLDGDDDRFLVCATDPGDSTDGSSGERAGDGDPDPADDRHPEPVGVVGFPWVFEDRQAAFLMYWMAPEYQGRGYATEATELLLDYAFRERGLHKVAAYVLVTNDASVAVLEKLGFEREGTLRREVFADGEWVDEYRYAVLADEWLEN